MREENKRRTLFNFYRKKQCQILCFQETHSDEETCEMWTHEWGGKAFYSHGTKQARGVAMLFDRQFQGKILKHEEDLDGRCIRCLIKCNDVQICVTVIYAPNKDSPTFFQEKIIRAHNWCEKMIVIGDFNLTLNTELDRKTPPGSKCVSNNEKAATKVKELMQELYLEDVWRSRNEGIKRYSWYRVLNKHQIQASRIDFALTSVGLCSQVYDIFYLNGVQTDHSAVYISLEIESVRRGPGFWKLNTSLLADPVFVHDVNAEIERQYSINKNLGYMDQWEIFKKAIRRFIQQWARRKSSEEQLAISQLAEYVTHTEDSLESITEAQMTLLQESRAELETLLAKKTDGIKFRSKAKWAMESECGTRYFFNLERTRYNAKVCNTLIDEQGEIISTKDEVLREQKRFYKGLYCSDPNVVFDIHEEAANKVDPESPAASEEQFSELELAKALKNMKNGSCPGSDGLPAEFYKVFWGRIKRIFVPAVKQMHSDSYTPSTLRLGILNLIPKGDKDTRYLKNLRPITLLNCDYKIIEKAISNRMLPALQEIIHEDQKGFLPNRRIAANIRRILDVICEINDNPGLIMSCDFMKCFDRIETSSVLGALDFFGFSSFIQHWVTTLYRGFRIRVQNNGDFSSDIEVTRSIHQGGPASNCYFLVVAELLAIAIRGNSEIRGLFVKEVLHLLNQFADDLDLFLEYNEGNLREVLNVFQEFQKNTGFALSYDKTTLYRIGSLKKSQAKLYCGEQFKWTGDSINVLGVSIHQNTTDLIRHNIDPIISKCEQTLNKWSNRTLSLYGKIQVINSLIASQLVYKLSVLPELPETYVKRLNELSEKFLWNGHRPKIPISVLQAMPEEGGLKLVNFKTKDVSLKVSWVHMLMRGMYPKEFTYHIIHKGMGEMIWCANLCENDVQYLKIQNDFWRSVVKGWCKYHFCAENSGDECLWFNSKIRIENAPVYFQEAHSHGLMFVSQLFENGSLIKQADAQDRFGLNFLSFNSLISAIPVDLKQQVRDAEYSSFKDDRFKRFNASEKPSKFIYQELCPTNPKLARNSERLCQEVGEEVDLVECVARIRHTTSIAKLKSFQYRLLNMAVVTNKQLMQWKIREDDQCTFCGEEEETYKHLFWECPLVTKMWEALVKMCELYKLSPPTMSYANVICNCVVENPNDVVNMLCLIVKQYVYRQRCLKDVLCPKQVTNLFYHHRNIEKYYAIKDNTLSKFHQRWSKFAGRDMKATPEVIEEYLQQINTQELC